MSYTRRDVLGMAEAGAAALWLGGCGDSNSAKPVAGDEWKQFGGTTLNFIPENTAPTSAIAANLKPFTDLTGIEIKIVQLELAATSRSGSSPRGWRRSPPRCCRCS
jgi:multiple sugar transport system substrate-binding protein